METELIAKHVLHSDVRADNMPETVDGETWQKVAADLRVILAEVVIDDLRYLQSKLLAGEIDGMYDAVIDGGNPDDWEDETIHTPCGCFVATIGHRIKEEIKNPTMVDWRAFELAYHEVPEVLTPAQCWLMAVRPGDKPSTHRVANAFFEELELMIGELRHGV